MTILIFVITTTVLMIGSFSFYLLEDSIKNSTEKLGADVIVIAKNADVRDQEFLHFTRPTTRYMNIENLDFLKKYPEVLSVSHQCYIGKVGERNVIGLDFSNDFIVKPWLDKELDTFADDVFIGGKNIDEDKLTIYGKEFTKVASLTSVGTDVDNVIFINMNVARKLANTNLPKHYLKNKNKDTFLTAAFLKMRKDVGLRNFADKINAESNTVKAISKAGSIQKIDSSISAVKKLVYFLFLFLFINSILSLFGRYMSIFSYRKKEIGYLRSVGISKQKVFLTMLYEIVIMGLISGLISALIASICTPITVRLIEQNFAATKAVFDFKVILMIFVVSPIFTICLGVISSIKPIFKYSKMQPISAISKGEL